MTREEAIADIRDNIKPVVGGKSLDMAIEALEQTRWIKCSDRLPNDELRVVMLLDNAWELVGWYDHYYKEWIELLSCMPTEHEVIAWMPLPKYEVDDG